ncbi:MAG: UDP-N-acetylmuramate--L-alanine ligase [Bacteroidales bacterium]|jgi:UDP-N-acetylmuramate--alanine ligase|nr:UDP-N-acetylmuramate--L-alanine ligase [Bacteroidales bacterium]
MKLDNDNIHTIYFLGIGGIGMSALAHFFLLQGKKVHGYDLTPSEITTQLVKEGAIVHFEEDVTKIPENVNIVVYTPAVPKEHKEYRYFVENNIPLLKRSEILGAICANYPTIAIAGTHGKTTTTAMATQILCGCRDAGCHVSTLSFIGGIAKNFDSNFVCETDFDTVIVEADEYDRSFLTLNPQVAVITSLDADHLDVYGKHEHLKTSFQLFANQIKPDGVLVIYDEIAESIEHSNKKTYGLSQGADYKVSDIQHFSIPGKHNILNAVAALAACIEFSMWKDKTADISNLFSIFNKKLSEFIGVNRRYDIRVQREDFVYIDDYAHHPEAIKAFLDAVKNNYPTRKLTGVFQPHLYTRTKDFAQEFAQSLEILDEIILLDIYPAREKPIEGITSGYLLSLLKNKNNKLINKEELVNYLKQNKLEVLLTMGAGDIDRLVKPLEAL